MADPVAGLMPDPPPALGPECRSQALDESAVRGLLPALPDERRSDLLLAAALLWHDHLEAAHRLVQAREGDREADCLHAIMHRREPDAGNSRYWWNRVGAHPLATAMAAEAARLGLAPLLAPDGSFRPAAMTAACCGAPADAAPLIALQAFELRQLAVTLLGP